MSLDSNNLHQKEKAKMNTGAVQPGAEHS